LTVRQRFPELMYQKQRENEQVFVLFSYVANWSSVSKMGATRAEVGARGMALQEIREKSERKASADDGRGQSASVDGAGREISPRYVKGKRAVSLRPRRHHNLHRCQFLCVFFGKSGFNHTKNRTRPLPRDHLSFRVEFKRNRSIKRYCIHFVRTV